MKRSFVHCTTTSIVEVIRPKSFFKEGLAIILHKAKHEWKFRAKMNNGQATVISTLEEPW